MVEIILVVGLFTGKEYFSCKTKNEANQWLIEEFPSSGKLRKKYPMKRFARGTLLPEPMYFLERSE